MTCDYYLRSSTRKYEMWPKSIIVLPLTEMWHFLHSNFDVNT